MDGMLGTIIRDEIRFLTFRYMSAGIREHPNAYLAFGLSFTWLAGVGRYWDHPDAWLWQYLGLGSVAYVFVLAAVLWLLILPLRPANWSYRNVLLFITLTAPPAVLYAIPVERFMSIQAAQTANAWFLAIVAAWRVALYAVFLRRVARLPVLATAVATLSPLVLIVLALVILNLEHATFNLMGGGIGDGPQDVAYQVVAILSLFSYLLAPFLLTLYLALAIERWRQARRIK